MQPIVGQQKKGPVSHDIESMLHSQHYLDEDSHGQYLALSEEDVGLTIKISVKNSIKLERGELFY